MPHPFIVGRLDLAELCLWTFGLFFFGLIIYLRREDRREGYPLEDEITGRLLGGTGTWLEEGHLKSYRLPFGLGTVMTPNYARDTRTPNARPAFASAGAPLVPNGDPMLSGVGPGAYAERARRPDLNMEGHPRIVPIGLAPTFRVSRSDPDFRGWPVVGCDEMIAGTVTDIWVDTSDRLIRYYEVELGKFGGAPGRKVLAPMFMSRIDKGRRAVRCDAIRAEQFANVPAIEAADRITLYEEERVQGYYGGGWLYATPERSEPLL